MVRSILGAAVAVVCAGMIPVTAEAATWNQAGGAHNWIDDINWTSPATHPNAPSAVANLNNDITSAEAITAPNGGVTVGSINIGDATNAQAFSVLNGLIIMDNGASDATINSAAPVTPAAAILDIISSTIQLNGTGNLIVNINALTGVDDLRLSGNIIAGTNDATPDTVTYQGLGFINLTGGFHRTYTGKTTVNIPGGRVRVSSGSSFTFIPGDVDITAGTLQDFNGNGNMIANTSNMFIGASGLYNPGGASETFGSLAGAQGAQMGATNSTVTIGNANNTVYSGIITNSGFELIKVGAGTLQLAGTTGNTTTVNGTSLKGKVEVRAGRLELNKTDGINAINLVPTIIGDNTGAAEIRLLNNNQFASGTNARLILRGQGTLNMNGFDDVLGPLAVEGASSIDMGNGSSTLTFGASGAQTWNGSIVNVLNWSGVYLAGGGADQLFIGADNSAASLTPAQLAFIKFVNPVGLPAGTYDAAQLANGEVVSVPEPTSLGLLGLGSLALLRRRRMA
jgi:hypothetical protein